MNEFLTDYTKNVRLEDAVYDEETFPVQFKRTVYYDIDGIRHVKSGIYKLDDKTFDHPILVLELNGEENSEYVTDKELALVASWNRINESHY